MSLRKSVVVSAFIAFVLSSSFVNFSWPNGHYFSVANLSDTIPPLDTTGYVKFERVEEEAMFTGGESAWRQYLEKNLAADIPTKKKAPAGTYTVVVQFILDREGYVSDVRALTNHGFGMEEEAVRVIKKSPKWIPAKQNGRVVKAYRKQPITFQVTEKKKKTKKSKDNE